MKLEWGLVEESSLVKLKLKWKESLATLLAGVGDNTEIGHGLSSHGEQIRRIHGPWPHAVCTCCLKTQVKVVVVAVFGGLLGDHGHDCPYCANLMIVQ